MIFDGKPAEHYAPYAGHVAPGVVLLMDSSLMAVIELHGAAFELETLAARNGRSRRSQALLRTIGDDNVAISVHLVRHRHVPALRPGGFASAFACELRAAYDEKVLSGLRANRWFIALVVKPRVIGAGFAPMLKRKLGRRTLGAQQAVAEHLEEVTRTVLTTLAEYGARRLAYRQEGEAVFSEIGEALYLIRTCRYRKVALVCGSLGAAIATDRVVVEHARRRVRLHLPGGVRWGTCLGLREYMAGTSPGMLNELLAADCDLSLSQSFAFLTRPQRTCTLLDLTGRPT